MKNIIEQIETSNTLSWKTYAPHFHRMDDERIRQLDLLSVKVDDLRIPLLRNGRNEYYKLACQEVVFSKPEFIDRGIPVDVHIIIPEGASLVAGLCGLEAKRALKCVLASFPDALVYWPPDSVPEFCHYLRLFDSHPSMLYYLEVAAIALGRLGIEFDIERTTFTLKCHPCDLGNRLVKLSVEQMFPMHRSKVVENSATSQRGRSRIMTNPEAPIKASLLIIGDSHSFSSLSPILTQHFERVAFFWASRVNRYKEAFSEIEQEARMSDFVIEESSERFFLRNFTSPDTSAPFAISLN